ncbi:hypothetical protein pb186bvf_006991 [Paramecium bursaria]
MLQNINRYLISHWTQPLVSVEFLKKNLNQVKIIDGSWYLPSQNRNADQEYLKEHIPGAIRFDIDQVSLKETTSPTYVTPCQII